MGGGSYCSDSFATRSLTNNYANKSTREVFKQRAINNAMNPYGVTVRESRDSAEHPNSLAIVLGLDVTGSMGSIPHQLIQKGLNDIMGTILEEGVSDPQVLFLGIGDHECDDAPLQVGQFESSDELLDKWLTDVYLEGGGGGNGGESYLLAWYFAALHTRTDCFEKRGQKGFVFTIGDEPTLELLPKRALKHLMGDGQYEDFSASDLFMKASEKFNVFHIHVKQTASGSRQYVMDGWKQLIQDSLIIVDRSEDIPHAMAEAILKVTGNKATPVTMNTTTPETEANETML